MTGNINFYPKLITKTYNFLNTPEIKLPQMKNFSPNGSLNTPELGNYPRSGSTAVTASLSIGAFMLRWLQTYVMILPYGGRYRARSSISRPEPFTHIFKNRIPRFCVLKYLCREIQINILSEHKAQTI